MSEVKNKMDFINLLVPDMSIKILTHLDDPCDLIRVSAVSSSWHRFVIEHELCKQLCLKMFPDITGTTRIIEENIIEPLGNTLGSYVNWECLKRNHKIYAFLATGLTPMSKSCISKAISASSTDNYPEESVLNTLEFGDRTTERRASYWSSKGESDPSVPETLLYKLGSNMCLVTEIHVQPFRAFFQHGFPIYSAKAVRFRMGHPRSPIELESVVDNMTTNQVVPVNQFEWTYTSPEFPMLQENRLQKFKLPEPVLCIGGVLVVELLGRVQKQEMDELYYICISHVRVMGQPLLPAFDVKIHHPSGKCTLKYLPQTDNCNSSSTSSPRSDSSNPSRLRTITSSIMQTGVRQFILGALLGSGSVVDD